MRRSIALASLTAALLSGCFYAPTGVNKAAESVPVPESGKVALSYTVPAGVDATKVTFKVEGQDAVQALDDSTNNPHTVSLDVSSIADKPGYYTVDVLLNDQTDPTAKLYFVIPDPNAGKASDGGTPAADATGAAPTSDTSGGS